MRSILLAAVTVVAIGCNGEAPRERTNAESTQTSATRTVGVDPNVASKQVGESFGLANTFSGKPSEEQERTLPDALRGAFSIESLRRITSDELAAQLKNKTCVAEEVKDGKRYVALKDFRHVQFSDNVSGQMIVIERYVVTAE